jgi:hypothetical protein
VLERLGEPAGVQRNPVVPVQPGSVSSFECVTPADGTVQLDEFEIRPVLHVIQLLGVREAMRSSGIAAELLRLSLEAHQSRPKSQRIVQAEPLFQQDALRALIDEGATVKLSRGVGSVSDTYERMALAALSASSVSLRF